MATPTVMPLPHQKSRHGSVALVSNSDRKRVQLAGERYHALLPTLAHDIIADIASKAGKSPAQWLADIVADEVEKWGQSSAPIKRTA